MADYYYTKKAGRPTKFKAEYVEKMIRFFEDAPLTRRSATGFTREFYKDGTVKRDSETFKEVGAMFPTLLRFAKSINVDYATVYRWSEEHGEEDFLKKLKSNNGVSRAQVELHAACVKFREVYRQAKMFQKEFLMENGLSGASPSQAFVFTAKNVTDMRDKSVFDVTHKEVRPLLDNLRNKKIINGVSNNNSDTEGS